MQRALALLLLFTACAEAKITHRRSTGQAQRRRMLTSPLITGPGGVDLEFSTSFDTKGGFTMPTTLKYTPARWHTEFSAGVDSVASLFDDNGNRTTHFSDHVNLAATTAFSPADNFSWAFAPTITVLLRGDEGVRIGGTLLARYDRGANTFSGAASWSGATVNSPTNPSGLFDITVGYARKIGRFTPYATVQVERATGISTQYSFFEGAEWEINRRLSFDAGVQQLAIKSPDSDHRYYVGLVYSLK